MAFSNAKSTRLIALVTMRITAGANTWRKVEGMMEVRRISRKRKRNVLSSCVTPAHMNAQETMALTEITEGPVLRENKTSKNNRGS